MSYGRLTNHEGAAKYASKFPPLPVIEPPRTIPVQVPFPVLGVLANAENAFFDLCIEVGQQVFSTLMEQDREILCGPKGQHDPERRTSRTGSTSSNITLGGRRIPVRRLRAWSRVGAELGLPSFASADRDPLDRHTMEAIACSVVDSEVRLEPREALGRSEERSTSTSAVSRRFVALSQKQMTAWPSAPLDALDLRVLVIDGIAFHGHTVLIVLVIDADGTKDVLGLREGTTENRQRTRVTGRGGFAVPVAERGKPLHRAPPPRAVPQLQLPELGHGRHDLPRDARSVSNLVRGIYFVSLHKQGISALQFQQERGSQVRFLYFFTELILRHLAPA